MKNSDSCETSAQFARFIQDGCSDPLAVALAAHKPITVNEHQAFRESFRPTDHFDDIDHELDEMIVVDPCNREPSRRKSDKELGRLLDVLDNLPRGKDAE